MREWRVLIVEDDEKVASIHRRVVSAHPGFHVTACARSSEEALRLIRRGVPIDLVLLDITLPGADGTSLMRVLRVERGPEVIAVTAARDPAVVEALMQLGAVDYLIKPFAMERLQQALIRFRERKRTLAPTHRELGQGDIDRLYSSPDQSLLPKGLQVETLTLVRRALQESGDQFSSADEVAGGAAVARVTARRYLEYLVSLRQVEMTQSVTGPGRPRKLYRRAALPQ
jgi:response regulator of citrate/malate metabolism